MRNVPIALLVFALTCASLDAQAADTGLYLGAGVGAYTLDIDDTDFDDNSTVAQAIVGFQLGNFLAVEGSYQKLFDVEDDVLGSEVELDADAWSLALRPMIPVTPLVDVYGKVGYAWYEVEAQTEIFGFSFSEDDSDSAFTWGAGVDVNLGKLSIRGEVSRIEIDDTDLNLVSAALLYHF